MSRQFLVDTLDLLDDLALGVGWDTEFDRDVWQLRRLGFPHLRATIPFDAIEPDWLRHLTKRWTRWRLSTGQTTTGVKPWLFTGDWRLGGAPTWKSAPELGG